jgi:hypothetical protein
MTPSEIIQTDAQNRGYNADTVLRKIAKVVKSGAGILLQEGNSLLLLIGLEGNNAELHLYTADKSPLTIYKAITKFVKKIRDSDLNAVYGSGDVPDLLQMLKKLGVDVQSSDIPGYKWMAPV